MCQPNFFILNNKNLIQLSDIRVFACYVEVGTSLNPKRARLALLGFIRKDFSQSTRLNSLSSKLKCNRKR